MNCPRCGNTIKEGMKFCPSCGETMQPTIAQERDPRIVTLEKSLGSKYKIIRKIGQGGFAEVFLGEHTQLGRNVAIKILHGSFAADEGMIERFRREAKSAAKLSHPNIIDIYDVGEGNDVYYFVMKYVEGETLGRKMNRDGKVSPGESIQIIRQVADALQYAHDQGVIHRDIKPGNVMLDLFGKPVLMDFGIARLQYEGNLTKTGTLMGTPHYLPPEQPLGKPVDGRSDIYSLGIMFYEMLAGKPPFHDENSVTLIFKHINEPPPQLQELVPELDADLCNVVHTMIEKLPEARYQTAGEVVLALETLAPAYPTTPSYVARKSTPSSASGARNTERLLMLAQENFSQEKFDKAIDIYATIFKRAPENADFRIAVDKVVANLEERIQKQIDQREFADARAWLVKLQKIPITPEKAKLIRDKIDRAEQMFRKDAEFQNHFEAAKIALEHKNAPDAISNLTKALTIDPDNTAAQKLLKEARAAYEENREKAEFQNAMSEAEYYFSKQSYDQALTAVKRALDIRNDPSAEQLRQKIDAASKEKAYKQAEQGKIFNEVDQLCEKLDFVAAQNLLESARSNFPDFVQTKSAVVERNRSLYDKFIQGKNAFERNKWEEGLKNLDEFLQVQLPYDFQAFYGLRKDAESMQKVAREKFNVTDIEQKLRKADVFLRMGQLEQARDLCKAVLERNPKNADALAKLKEIEAKAAAPEKMAAPAPEIPQELVQEIVESRTVQVPVPKPAPPVPPPVMEAKPQAAAQTTPEPVPPPAPITYAKAAPASPPPLPPRVESAPQYEPEPFTAEPPAGGKPFPLIPVIGGAAVLLIALIAFLFWPSSTPTTTPRPPQQTDNPQNKNPVKIIPTPALVSVSIDAQPWAEIEITGKDGKQKYSDSTPCYLTLPEGSYTVVFTPKSPGLQQFTKNISVTSSQKEFSFAFPALNADQIADTLLKE